MECNRDEAVRAKAIAEGKIVERDFAGARKFALKAQNLYPGLEGLSQMLTTLDVYISAENKISGEADWYGVIGVNPLADEETVRKQYRKLALMLHPDKNKSAGADGAFKILSEAWSLLSDKVKRLAYNQRRSSKGFQPKVPTQSGRPSAAPSANGFHKFTNRATSKPKTQKNSAPPPSYRRTDTFWTICHQCKMHYEYLKVYLNHTLLCPNCHGPFLASEMAPPVNFSKSSNPSPRQQHQNSSHVPNNNPFDPGRNAATAQNSGPGVSAGLKSKHTNIQWGPFSRKAGAGNAEPSIAAKAANVVQQANEKLKREREECSAGWENPLKKRRGLDNDGYCYGGKMPYQMAMGNGGPGTGSEAGLRKGSFETDRIYGFASISSRLNSTRELTHLETRNMLMEKAQMEIRKKLHEWSSETVTRAADAGKEKVKETVKDHVRDLNGNGEPSITQRADQAETCFTSTSAEGVDKKDIVPLSMNVPDPDFHDFDQDRTERSFGENQVWAGYDDDDGMPRFYAIIHKVISRKPFKMRISWLNSKTNSEFGPIDWVGSGFSKTCGEFRVGRYELNKSLNSFSHEVKWAKGTRGSVHIFPRKGDVWALYKNWSKDWNEHTPDDLIHKYEMIKVLDDYNEEQGVSVTPLIKVAGFRTVFYPHLDPDKVKKIPKEEMFRFSHQVPNYLLTGQEAPNAPKGCLELDPAATPLELLQVITETNEVPEVDNGEKVEEEMLQSATGIRVDEIMDGAKAKEEKMVEIRKETKEGETMGVPK